MRNAILTLCVLAIATSTASAQQAWAEKMFKGELTHDFGTVPHGAQMLHRFTITNIYAVRMEITDITPSCGCVTTNVKKILEPRESAVFEVMMDGKRFTGQKEVSVKVTVGPEFVSTAVLRVSAFSRADVVFNPGQVNFGAVPRGQTPTQIVDIEYAGQLPWQITEVVAKDLPIDATIKEHYRSPGKVGYQLAVTPKVDIQPGIFKEKVYLRTNDPATPTLELLVEGNIQAAITVAPNSFRFTGPDKIKAGDTLTRRVIVKGNKPFRVLGVDGGNEITLGGEVGPAALQQTVVLRCQFTDAGDFKREVQIKTDLQAEPLIVVIEANVVP
jgi:hypothetical protein